MIVNRSLPDRLGKSGSRTASAALTVLALLAHTGQQPARAQSSDGERLFHQRCGACHTLEENRPGSAPHLAGIFGRRAGSLASARYSRALKETDIVWDRQSLDTFLQDPRALVPGTRMKARVPSDEERAAILDHLEQNRTADGDQI